MFDPREFRLQPLLQAPDQGHPSDLSTPAEPGGRDHDGVPLDPGVCHAPALRRVLLIPFLDDRLDPLDVGVQKAPQFRVLSSKFKVKA